MALQLNIINCLGIFISEEDHTLLSRVNIFYTLEELIESALSLGVESRDDPSSPQSIPTFPLPLTSFTTLSAPVLPSTPSPPPTPSCNSRAIQVATKAAMKLFIFLALRVATSGERDMSYTVSKFAAISLKRARSGNVNHFRCVLC